MSLLSRKRLRIALCPDRLLLASWRGGLRPALEAGEVAVDGGGEPPLQRRATDPPFRNWQAAVDRLPAALSAARPGKTRVTVVLSNHFTRYVLLPWNSALNSDDEWLAFARHRFESVHGPAVADWEVRVAATTARGARVASAVDRALIEAVTAHVADAGALLVSVQPYLMAAFNRMLVHLAKEHTYWLAVGEPGRLVLVLIRDGAWHSIRSRRVEDDWRERLPEMLERESAGLALEQPCTEVAIHTPETLESALEQPHAEGDYRLHDLTLCGGIAGRHRPLAMAL